MVENGQQPSPYEAYIADTYMKLLEGYYLLECPAQLKAKASAMFLWLLHRAYELEFPITLRLPNSVVQGGAGLDNPSAIHSTRKVLLNTYFGHSKLVSYRKPIHSSRCGVYTINYDLLLDRTTFGFYNESQSLVNQESIASQSLPYNNNKREENPEDSLPSKNKDDEEKYKKVVGLLIKACPSWYPTNDFIIDRVNDLIRTYPEHQIEIVITNAGKKGIKSTAFLTYVEKGLDNFEAYYGAQSNGKANGERSGKISNKAADEMTEMIGEYEKKVREEMEAAGGKEAYAKKRKKLFKDAGFDIGDQV